MVGVDRRRAPLPSTQRRARNWQTLDRLQPRRRFEAVARDPRFYAFRAQSDPDRLLAALEAIIIKKVLGDKGS